MKRLHKNPAWLALAIGLGSAGAAYADAEPNAQTVPFCAAKQENWQFPCRSANQAVVNNKQELMANGGVASAETIRIQNRQGNRGESGPRLPASSQPAVTLAPPEPATGNQPVEAERKEKDKGKDKAKADNKDKNKAERDARKAREQRDAEERKALERQLAEEQRKADEANRRADDERRMREEAERQARALKQQRLDAEEAARRAARRAERRAERAASADAAGAGTPDDVREEVVREGSVRTSSEDFDTSVAGTGRQTMAPRDDGGLNDGQKALLFGLGALAIGKILDNGDEVVSNSGDRVVVRRDGELSVLKNDDALLRRPGDTVRTEQFNDGSTRTTVTRPNGVRVITVRAADGRVLRRSRVARDGTEYVLFDDTRQVASVDTDRLPASRVDPQRPAAASGDDAALRRALQEELRGDSGRRFSLDQIRSIAPVRYIAPEIEVEAVTFASGSAAIRPAQARELADLGQALEQLLRERPDSVLLIEGHTDAVGDASYNLALSDRRAESVALALTEYFDIPPENLVIQGYGEQFLKVPVPTDEPANRRAVVRNITPLLN